MCGGLLWGYFKQQITVQTDWNKFVSVHQNLRNLTVIYHIVGWCYWTHARSAAPRVNYDSQTPVWAFFLHAHMIFMHPLQSICKCSMLVKLQPPNPGHSASRGGSCRDAGQRGPILGRPGKSGTGGNPTTSWHQHTESQNSGSRLTCLATKTWSNMFKVCQHTQTKHLIALLKCSLPNYSVCYY